MALSVLFHHRLLLSIIRPPDVTDDETVQKISAQDPQKAKNKRNHTVVRATKPVPAAASSWSAAKVAPR